MERKGRKRKRVCVYMCVCERERWVGVRETEEEKTRKTIGDTEIRRGFSLAAFT